MIKFSKEKVLLLHQIMAEATGGSVGVRDESLLDSALEGAFAGFGDQEFYPTKEEKGARLGYTLISNHAFVDGNKRIGAHAMLVFLALNGYVFSYTQKEGKEFNPCPLCSQSLRLIPAPAAKPKHHRLPFQRLPLPSSKRF